MQISITGSPKEIAELVHDLHITCIQFPVGGEWTHELTLEEMPKHTQAPPPPDLMQRMTCEND